MHEVAPGEGFPSAALATPAGLTEAGASESIRLVRIAAVVAAVVALGGLLGWVLNLGTLRSLLADAPTMQPWTATGILLAALALGLATFPSRRLQAVSTGAVCAVVLVAGVPLVEKVTGLDFGTDLLLFPDALRRVPPNRLAPPGRITPLPALALLAIATAVLLAPRIRRSPGRIAFSVLGTATLVASAASLAGNLIAPEPVYALLMGQVPALHTSLALTALAVGTIALRPDVGWVRRVEELGRTGWGAAALLGVAALLLAYGAQATVAAGTEAYDSARTALRLESLLSTLKDAETGQRGYLLTGDESYLAPYEAARARLPAALDVLDQNEFRNSAPTTARVRALTEAKLGEMSETIARRRAGDLSAALEVVRSGRGMALMVELRARLDELTAVANTDATEARNDELRAGTLAAVGALGVMGLALWAVLATSQARRLAAERAAAAARAQGAAEAEARRAEERLRSMQTDLAHANRLATMGQLTASIAHEVRQPIAASVANAHAGLRWLRADPPELEEVRQAFDRIVRDGNRAGEVITRVRTLLRKEPPKTEALDINEVVQQVVALLQGEAVRNGFAIRTQLLPDLPPVQADRVQVQQVLLNLMVNAIEAMQTAPEDARELLVCTHRWDEGAQVAVRDSGPGLGDEAPEHVFEAFYTTKPGSLGMGLSICRSIIEAHGGRLWAEANQPRGAVFQFTLPCASARGASAESAQPGSGTSETAVASGAVAGPSASPRPFQRK